VAIENEIDRFSSAIDAAPRLQRIDVHAKEKYHDQHIDCRNYA
jgi:hypothetical protein